MRNIVYFALYFEDDRDIYTQFATIYFDVSYCGAFTRIHYFEQCNISSISA